MNKKTLLFACCFFSITGFVFCKSAEKESQSQTAENQIYTLDDLKTAIALNNPDLLLAQEEYKQSLYDLKDARSSISPTINFQASGTYMLNAPIGSISINTDDLLNQIQWPNGFKPAATGQYIKLYDGMEPFNYNFGLSLSQPVFTWGKITNAIKLYSEVSKIQELKYQNQKDQLEAELETRLSALFYLSSIKDILIEEKEYADRLVSYSEDAESNGMLLHQDVVDAKIQAKEIDMAIQDINQQISNQLIELSRETGIDNLKWESINYSLDEKLIPQTFEKDRDLLMEKALSGDNNNIKMVMQLKTVNDLATKIAKGSMYYKPDIGLQMSASYGGSRVPLFEPNWLRKDDYTVNISIGVQTTIWDGGKKLNDVARKTSQALTSQINVDSAKSTIRKTISEQWNTADVSKIKVEYQELKIETALSKIEQANTLYMNGYGSESDVLSAKIVWCNERIAKVQQELALVTACYTLKILSM